MNKAIELDRKGWSLREIARELGVDHKTIASDLRNKKNIEKVGNFPQPQIPQPQAKPPLAAISELLGMFGGQPLSASTSSPAAHVPSRSRQRRSRGWRCACGTIYPVELLCGQCGRKAERC